MVRSIVALLVLGLSGSAWAGCEEVKKSIEDKIRKNGVEKFTLVIIDAKEKADGKVVGNCDGETKNIVYKKGG